MKKLLMLAVMLTGVLWAASPVAADKEVHIVDRGDTLYNIAKDYGISAYQLMELNDKQSSMIYPGERLELPVTLNESQIDLLSRLVEAEAKGESYAGKVAVATVVLNRVESDLFPDTLRQVIYQDYQFTPVSNGQIYQPASQQSEAAVYEALAYQGYDNNSLFFYNPDKASSAYLAAKEVTVVIGDHVFLR
ncbi:cell wall hydrolase [Halobacillus litoralis]|uniref:cell wall hydrolase n=1 Tax=Halobacillus litoralis TaxID=45668 RepID=UPI001CD7B00B|nr:cell wall hydrolase [Halobacillus litoralis]MCA0972447.1 cell wall hydrolase [Halobacillus litoralis]